MRRCSLVCCAVVIVAPSCWRNIPRPGVIRYQCSGYLLNRDRACCVMFGGLRADRLVSEQLLQSLTPFGMEAAIEAIESLRRHQRRADSAEGIGIRAGAL